MHIFCCYALNYQVSVSKMETHVDDFVSYTCIYNCNVFFFWGSWIEVNTNKLTTLNRCKRDY